MKHLLFFILLAVTSLVISCRAPVHNGQEWTMPHTTDSLALDIFGLRLGEYYSEQSLFDTLKLRMDGLDYLSEMKVDNWRKDAFYFLQIEGSDRIYFVGRKHGTLLDLGSIPLNRAFFYTTPDGILYMISVSQDYQEYDRNSADYLYKSTTAELAKSFGDPVYTRPQINESKYYSFKTRRIKYDYDEGTLDYQTSSWSDGIRRLDFGYIGMAPNSYLFSLEFKDETLSQIIEGK